VPINADLLPVAGERTTTAYARRRQAMVDALNQCDRVHAVSRFVARTYERMGVRADLIETITIGTDMGDLARRNPQALRHAPAAPDAPVGVVFIGYNNRAKGLDLLLEALERSDPGVLARVHLRVHALGIDSIAGRIRRLEARLARLTVSGEYAREDVPWLVGDADLGVVPSVWWDNGPQTVLEMLACGVPVLGANLGGIPDFIEPGVNGLLFDGNDTNDLCAQLRRVVLDHELRVRLRAGIRQIKSMVEHAGEIESLYARCLAGQSPQARQAV